MQQSTHIHDDTMITRPLIEELYPYQADYCGEVVRAYRALASLVAYAEGEPRSDLDYLREFSAVRVDGIHPAMTYRDFMALADDKRNAPLITMLYRKLDCAPWPNNGILQLRQLRKDLEVLRLHLESVRP